MNIRFFVAMRLRGEGWKTPWHMLSAAQRRPWLEMADTALAAIAEYNRETAMLAKIEKRLVDDWKECWRWASMRFNALASILVGAALYNLDTLAAVLAMAPPEVRVFIPIPVMVALFVTVAALRLWKQNRAK